jgi:hypothetical protein
METDNTERFIEVESNQASESRDHFPSQKAIKPWEWQKLGVLHCRDIDEEFFVQESFRNDLVLAWF